MSNILEELCQKATWEAFFYYKKEKQVWGNQEEKAWQDFIDQEAYLQITNALFNGSYTFSLPIKKQIDKVNQQKKRTVYLFQGAENKILKVIVWLLYRYDEVIPSNCYSFRPNSGARKAIQAIVRTPNIDKMYGYKVDISNYFNSIDTTILLEILKKILLRGKMQDKQLYLFFADILTQDKAIVEKEVIEEKRGAMAGTPIAAFFANIYLMEMDEYFAKRKVCYARYSDDILIFSQTIEELEEHKKSLLNFLDKYHLSVNKSKEHHYEPEEPWEFLGIVYSRGNIDLSPNSVDKMMGKIKRKARAIYRWKTKKNASTHSAMKVLNRVFCAKYFCNSRSDEMTWTRWYFPLITVDVSLKKLDQYLQSYLRYLSTGRFTKKNYQVTYDKMKQCGYRSLVNEYHKWCENNIV